VCLITIFIVLIDGIYFLYGCKLDLHRCFCFICSFRTFWLFNLYLYIQHKHDYVCKQWTGQLAPVRVTIVCYFLYFTLQKPLLFSEVIIIMYSTLTLLVRWQEGHLAFKNGGWWRWALGSLDRVAPSQTVSVSASVNLPLYHKVQKFSSGTGSPGWSRKMGRKTVVLVVVVVVLLCTIYLYFQDIIVCYFGKYDIVMVFALASKIRFL